MHIFLALRGMSVLYVQPELVLQSDTDLSLSIIIACKYISAVVRIIIKGFVDFNEKYIN